MDQLPSRLEPYFKESSLREEILNNAQVKEVPAGTELIREGTYIKVVPIVLSGSVKVFRAEEEKEFLLYYINTDESCIMSISTIFNDKKTNFKAVAEDDSALLLIPARLIPIWQSKYESFNLFISDLYKQRFEDLLKSFNAVVFQKVDERLLSYLQQKAANHTRKEIYATHQNIADELGIARETASRLLKKLEHDNVLELSRGVIKLKDF